jgi:Ribbon-helix-helix protein, copG family
MRYRMVDVLIRDVPAAVVAAVDAKAARLGLSRTEYLRRALAREGPVVDVTVDDLAHFADAFPDLTDTDVLRQAWE